LHHSLASSLRSVCSMVHNYGKGCFNPCFVNYIVTILGVVSSTKIALQALSVKTGPFQVRNNVCAQVLS
jgi:hypothetical protein